MLPFENAKLLPKSEVFQEQVAARAKEASGHDRQKPQQAHHENSFTRVHAKASTQPTYLIRQQIAILASHSQDAVGQSPRREDSRPPFHVAPQSPARCAATTSPIGPVR